MKFKNVLPVVAVISIGLTSILSGCQSNTSSTQRKESISLEETKITTEGGVQIYLRHKKQTKAKEAVLFLEPFSVPTAKAFDVPGYSWMDDLASKGYDTWAMDFRGFGGSTRPKEMNQPPNQNKPVVTHTEAIKDLAATVEHIKKTQKVEKVSIVGWSWGAVVAGEYAAQKPENVNKLVLYGFMHGFSLPSMTKPFESPKKPGEFNPKSPAYQVIDFDKGMHHWHMMMNGKELASDDAMEKVRTTFIESDDTSKTRENQAIRRPMGPLQDLFSIWTDRPLYDVSKITSPTLVIYGDSDFFAEKNLLQKLTGVKEKKEVVIPEATHWALYEKNRDQLLKATEQFLQTK
ncbi:Pimeloyl-ACP methyl ester carboxylesterase [Thermoactinomyces sp. DSM 45891]|uniref:alpha/beta hydrolase n=1 Tax=Thermoactinomyces sp. DSM 45891 TaxID=1761907 RepID=UPI000910EE36|nr:alpha/beta hydrolase [Thermoactinomyces sp. DSM 45891]SFW98425.1 Pimeloyl-ACP methyl ester carboxylesterase [Thermoactinomyces sp. DSM 45891]